MATRLMPLRRDGICARCSCALPASTSAWWNAAAKKVTCSVCGPLDEPSDPTDTPTPAPTPVWAPPPLIEVGVGGISAKKEYERRAAKHEKAVEEKWGTGRIGRVAKHLSVEPQSTTAWAKGAAGERRLARMLSEQLDDVAIVLHDRKVPGTRGNIDHLVIAPTGVWIVDAKNYTGKVEVRDVGGWFRTDIRLFVANRDKTKLVDSMAWQVEAVAAVLAPIGFSELPVRPVLCFTNSEWGLFAKPLTVKGVRITWATKLVEAIREPGAADERVIDLVARQLSSKLPAST